jgi:hypothetical protein
MLVADLFTVPEGTSPDVVDQVLTQLQLAFPALCLGLTKYRTETQIRTQAILAEAVARQQSATVRDGADGEADPMPPAETPPNPEAVFPNPARRRGGREPRDGIVSVP